MGARAHMFPRLMQIMGEGIHFGFVGRPERASPGEGYPAAHAAEQSRIVRTAPGSGSAGVAVSEKDSGRALMGSLWRRFRMIMRQRKRKRQMRG